MRRKQVTDNQMIAFNTLRMNKTGFYDREEIISFFKEIHFPCSSRYMAAYLKYNMIIHCGKNKYQFPFSPVQRGPIMNAFSEVREKLSVSSKEFQNRIRSGLNVEQCISFLKSKGYKIYKQTTNYEEV